MILNIAKYRSYFQIKVKLLMVSPRARKCSNEKMLVCIVSFPNSVHLFELLNKGFSDSSFEHSSATVEQKEGRDNNSTQPPVSFCRLGLKPHTDTTDSPRASLAARNAATIVVHGIVCDVLSAIVCVRGVHINAVVGALCASF